MNEARSRCCSSYRSSKSKLKAALNVGHESSKRRSLHNTTYIYQHETRHEDCAKRLCSILSLRVFLLHFYFIYNLLFMYVRCPRNGCRLFKAPLRSVRCVVHFVLSSRRCKTYIPLLPLPSSCAHTRTHHSHIQQIEHRKQSSFARAHTHHADTAHMRSLNSAFPLCTHTTTQTDI